MTQSNQTKNTTDDLRQQFRAALEANYPGTTATKQFLDHCMMFATQTKQETIQACKDALPEKTDRFTDPTDWVGINKTVDTAHTALNKLRDNK
jgi:hypothetical protein